MFVLIEVYVSNLQVWVLQYFIQHLNTDGVVLCLPYMYMGDSFDKTFSVLDGIQRSVVSPDIDSSGHYSGGLETWVSIMRLNWPLSDIRISVPAHAGPVEWEAKISPVYSRLTRTLPYSWAEQCSAVQLVEAHRDHSFLYLSFTAANVCIYYAIVWLICCLWDYILCSTKHGSFEWRLGLAISMPCQCRYVRVSV